MKAYKYRGADQIPFALDILLKQRLYCSDWRVLNDPLEGSFSYSYPTLSRSGNALNTDYFDDLADLIVDEKMKKKICSMSATISSPLLWAHYASGFTGLALEFEIPDEDDRVRRVMYTEDPTVDLCAGGEPGPLATHILSSKFRAWSYEEEIRIIQDEVWFRLPNPVTRVICGPRMNSAMFEALALICKAKDISISKLHIDHDGIDPTGSRSPTNQLLTAWKDRNEKTEESA
ncbi:MAG: hypothetical protein R3F03_15045 [Opitutaceae bacterium]